MLTVLMKLLPKNITTNRFNFSVSDTLCVIVIWRCYIFFPSFTRHHLSLPTIPPSFMLSFLSLPLSLPPVLPSLSPSSTPFLLLPSPTFFHPLPLSTSLFLPPFLSLSLFLASQSWESTEGPNIVHTGKGNLSKLAQFIEWNGRYKIAQWGTPAARMINGTGGFMFHPGVTREENLTAFISELFR